MLRAARLGSAPVAAPSAGLLYYRAAHYHRGRVNPLPAHAPRPRRPNPPACPLKNRAELQCSGLSPRSADTVSSQGARKVLPGSGDSGWGLVSQLARPREGFRVTRATHPLAWHHLSPNTAYPPPLFTCELGVSSEGPVLLMGLR